MLASGWDWREDARNWRPPAHRSRRRAEETKPVLMDTRHEAGRRCEAPGFRVVVMGRPTGSDRRVGSQNFTKVYNGIAASVSTV